MSAAARPAPLRVIADPSDGAVRRLHVLMRQREALRPLFRLAWDNLSARFDADELEGWAAGVLDLADVNAGPSCLMAFWQLSRDHPTERGIAPLTVNFGKESFRENIDLTYDEFLERSREKANGEIGCSPPNSS